MIVPPSQRGAALLTVLLLVAVMATVAATALDRIGVAIRLAANVSTIAQSRAWLGTAELLALTRIEDLLAADQTQTTLRGGWLGVERSIALPDGASVRATVGDGGNCFNLNSLVERQADGRIATRSNGVAQFVGLMTLLGIAPGEADRIARSTADSIIGNAVLADVSELRAVAGVTARHYGMVERWLCALPTTELAPINVNTLMVEQAPLLAMLAPGVLDVARARAQLSARPTDGYGSVLQFWKSPVFSGLEIPDRAAQQIKVRTSFFTLRAIAGAGDVEVQEAALIDARTMPARIVRRQWGEAN